MWKHKNRYIEWRIKVKHGEIKSQQLINIKPDGIKKTVKIREFGKTRQITAIEYPPVKQYSSIKT